ncbi:MAG: hypothetical protein ABEI53_00900 [Candidatus Magasanikbacteria bacterium]
MSALSNSGFKPPEDDSKYSWTWHASDKMRYYRIYPGRVKRIIRSPERVEEGIAPNTVAAMQTAGNKNREEIWVMYQPTTKTPSPYKPSGDSEKIRIITAWRYPGESSKGNPVPKNIMKEVESLL